MRRTLLLTLMCMLLVGGLMACDQTNFTIPTTITTTTTSSTTSSTTTTQQEELTLQLMAIYNLAISSGSYAGTYEEWLESVRGPAGREVLMRVSSGYIQWQYVGEATWNNLVSLASIMGPQGLPGKESNFRVSDGFIQWQYVGDTTWKNLIELTLLIGAQGSSGKEVTFQVAQGYIQWQYVGESTWTNLVELTSIIGPQGISGKEASFRVSEGFIQWQYVGDATWQNLIELTSLLGPQGMAGREIDMRVNSGFIQWQYVGDPTWTNLVEVASIIGPQGAPGVDGLPITLRVQDGFIQWQYVGSTVWSNLIETSTLIGPAGATPTISINENGYWVINGVTTNFKAVGSGSVEPIQLNVEFVLQGGILPDGFQINTTVYKGDSMNLPIPTKDGYLFLGWVTGTTVNDLRFTSYTPFTRNTVLYATWALDLAPITSFFMLASSSNLTGQKILNAVIQTPQGLEYYRQENMIKIQSMSREIYVYKSDVEMSKLGDQSWETHRTREAYEVYIGSWSNDSLYRTRAQRMDDGNWYLYSENYSSLHQEIDLSMFDPSQFVKRPGEQIYDYPITLDLLRLLDIPVDDGLTIDMATGYLDVTHSSIVITIIGATIMGGSSYPVEATIVMSIQDVGTTIVDLPYTSIVDNLLLGFDQMVDEIKTSQGYLLTYDEYQLYFDTLVEDSRLQLYEMENIHDLSNQYWNIYMEILYINFPIDSMKELRHMYQYDMIQHVEYMSNSATDDSILAMQAILAYNIDLLMSATTEAQIYVIADAFYQEISNAYIADSVKLQVEYARQRAIDFLHVYLQLIDPILANDEDDQMFYDIFNTHMNLLMEANSLLEITLIYEACVEEWILSPLEFLDFTEGFNFLIYQITTTYEYLLDYVIDDTAQLDTIYYDYLDDLMRETNPILIIKRSILAYVSLNALVLELVKVQASIVVQEHYNERTPLIEESYLEELEIKYLDVLAHIQLSLDIWQVWDKVHYFLDYLYSLPIDHWQLDLEYMSTQFLIYAANLRDSATVESAEAIQLIMDQFIINIYLIPENDYDFMYQFINDQYNLVENAFVMSFESELLQEQKDKASNTFFQIFWNTEYYYVLTESELITLYTEINAFIDEIYNATTIDDVWMRYDDAVLFLTNYPMSFYSFQDLLDYYAQYLEHTVGYWNSLYQLDDELLIAYVDSLITDILEAPSPIIGYVLYLHAFDELFNVYLEPIRSSVLETLEDNYSYFYSVIEDTDLVILDELYAYYLQVVQNETDIYEFYYHLMNFVDEAYYLNFNELKIAISVYIYNIGIYYDSLAETASPESLVLLNALLLEAQMYMQNAIDTDELYLIYVEYASLMEEAYIYNPSLDTLNKEIQYWLSLLGSLEYYLGSIVEHPTEYDRLWNWFYTYQDQLQDVQSLSELEILTTQLQEALWNLNLNFVYDFEWIREIYLSELYYDFQLLSDYIQPLPEYIVTYYFYQVNYITTITNPIDLIFYAEEVLLSFENISIEAFQIYLLGMVANTYNEYIHFVTPNGLNQLNELKTLVFNQVTNSNDIWVMYNYFYEFYMALNYVEIDSLLFEIWYAALSIQFEYNYMSKTATTDSIQAMGNIVETWILLFNTAETIDEISLMVQSAYDELFAAYVEDPQKAEFLNLLYEYDIFLYHWITLINAWTLDAFLHHQLWNYYNEVLQDIYLCTIIEDLELIQQNVYSYLTSISYDWSLEETEIIDLLTIDLLNYFYNGLYYTGYFPYETYISYLEIQANVENAPSVIESFYQLLMMQKAVYDLVLDATIAEGLVYLEENHQYYLDRITDESALSTLSLLYTDYQGLIQSSKYWGDPMFYVDEFVNSADELPYDILKAEKTYYINNLLYAYQEIILFATDDSIVDIYAYKEATLALLLEATDINTLHQIFYDGINNMHNANIIDDTKVALSNAKYELSVEFYYIMMYCLSVVSSDSFSNNLAYAYQEYLMNEINAITSMAELELVWDNYIYLFLNTPVQLTSYNSEEYEDYISNVIGWHYGDYVYNYDPLPSEITAFYNQAINDLLYPVSPLTYQEMYYIFYTFRLNTSSYIQSIPA